MPMHAPTTTSPGIVARIRTAEVEVDEDTELEVEVTVDELDEERLRTRGNAHVHEAFAKDDRCAQRPAISADMCMCKDVSTAACAFDTTHEHARLKASGRDNDRHYELAPPCRGALVQ